jgi:hypothetical protein
MGDSQRGVATLYCSKPPILEQKSSLENVENIAAAVSHAPARGTFQGFIESHMTPKPFCEPYSKGFACVRQIV